MRKLFAALLICLPVFRVCRHSADRRPRRTEHDLLHVLDHHS
jgi:hypothetical protein